MGPKPRTQLLLSLPILMTTLTIQTHARDLSCDDPFLLGGGTIVRIYTEIDATKHYLDGKTKSGTLGLRTEPKGFAGTKWTTRTHAPGIYHFASGGPHPAKWLNGKTLSGMVNLEQHIHGDLIGTRWRLYCKNDEWMFESLGANPSFLSFNSGEIQLDHNEYRWRIEHIIRERVIFRKGVGGYDCYRIPAIVQASPNVLLAFAEGRKDSCSDTGDIDVVMRRSEDGGSTWQNMIAVLSKDIGVPWEHHGSGQQTWGNPTVLYDEAKGRVWLFVTHNLGVDDQEGITKLDGNQGLRTIWNMHSDDDGRTWSAPFFLGHELQNPDHRWDATGPGTGIVLQIGELVVPANGRDFWSTDHGRSWRQGPSRGGSESQIAELADGSIIAHVRNVQKPVCRSRLYTILSRAEEGHEGQYGPLQEWSETQSDGVQGSIASAHGTDSNASTKLVVVAPLPRKPGECVNKVMRRDLTVLWMGDDTGNILGRKILWEGPAAYSSITRLENGYFAVLFEAGKSELYEGIMFARLTENWMD